MAIPTRSARPGTFFVTTSTHARRRLFQVSANADLLLETLQHYRVQRLYKLHAFVVMPDHLHLLLTPQTITLERSMQLIKGGFSHRLTSRLPVWQRGFTDHRIRDRTDFETRRTYIHQNPVRAVLVTAAELYPYSSEWTSGAKAPFRNTEFGTAQAVPLSTAAASPKLNHL